MSGKQNMCGRIAQTTTIQRMENLIHIAEHLDLVPHYNIAPSMAIHAIRLDSTGLPHWVQFRWGLIPHWAKEPKASYSTFNAKSETVAQKPTFRDAYRKRRCVIPVDGFYEWRREGTQKQPFFIRRKDTEPMLLAGLWEAWEGPESYLESCTILTTQANQVLSDIHHRMPVVIDQLTFAAWMNPLENAEIQTELLGPYENDILEKYPVDTCVNKTSHDAADCMDKIKIADKKKGR